MTWWRLETLNASEDVQEFEDIQGYLGMHVKQVENAASPQVSYRQCSSWDSDASLGGRACLQQWELTGWFQATRLKACCPLFVSAPAFRLELLLVVLSGLWGPSKWPIKVYIYMQLHMALISPPHC